MVSLHPCASNASINRYGGKAALWERRSPDVSGSGCCVRISCGVGPWGNYLIYSSLSGTSVGRCWCPGQEVALLVCVALDLTAHHEIVQMRNWSSEDLPLKGVYVSSCPAMGHHQRTRYSIGDLKPGASVECFRLFMPCCGASSEDAIFHWRFETSCKCRMFPPIPGITWFRNQTLFNLKSTGPSYIPPRTNSSCSSFESSFELACQKIHALADWSSSHLELCELARKKLHAPCSS